MVRHDSLPKAVILLSRFLHDGVSKHTKQVTHPTSYILSAVAFALFVSDLAHRVAKAIT